MLSYRVSITTIDEELSQDDDELSLPEKLTFEEIQFSLEVSSTSIFDALDSRLVLFITVFTMFGSNY